MQTVPLKATPRTEHGKGPARRLRAAGMVPVVAYGLGGETVAVAVPSADLRAILTSPRGRNTIIDLQVEGGQALNVMVKEYTVHPLSRNLLHADFIRIDENSKVECEVPFHPVGKSRGEAEGGTLLASLRTLKVLCMPTAIPDHIEYQVEHLAINDVVKVKDLQVPPGVEILLPPERKVITVQPPRVLEDAAAEGGAPTEGEAAAEGGEGEAKADGADEKKE